MLRNSDVKVELNRTAFESNYKVLRRVDIGSLSVVCQHCNGLKFKSETPGVCCAGGTVKLPVLINSPDPLPAISWRINQNTMVAIIRVTR